jgi:CRP-like cAMP-binding protein
VETTTADYIPREALAACLAAAPAAAARLLQVMARRLRQTDPYVGELTNVHAPDRRRAARPRRR